MDPRLPEERRIEAILAGVIERHPELQVETKGARILPPRVAENALRGEWRTTEADELVRLVAELGW